MKCLVIEESSTLKSLYLAFLKNLGIQAKLTTEKECIDLLSLEDYELIIVSTSKEIGISLIKEIRKQQKYQTIPILFVAHNLTLQKREEVFLAGGNYFLQKPFIYEDFVEVLENIKLSYNWFLGAEVLVLDDSIPNRKIASLYLTKAGINVTECSSGYEALEILLANPNKFDLILTDQNMPEMNGDEFCIKVRNVLGLKNIPIIFLSADSNEKDIKKIYEIGANDYIHKPLDKSIFLAKLLPHIQNSKSSKIIKQNKKSLSKLQYFQEEVFDIILRDMKTSVKILKFNFKETHQIFLPIINKLEKISLDFEKLSNSYLLEDQTVQSLSVSFLLDRVLKSQEEYLKIKNIQVSLQNQVQQVQIKGNWKILHKIVLEVFTNAIQYSNYNSIIEVTSIEKNNYLQLSIQDQGVGIEEEILNQLLIKKLQSTSGGGLYIANKLAEKMGGKILITSKKGEGTKVDIQIPLTT
jgi:two-component system sensor histidine kinase/response regulator